MERDRAGHDNTRSAPSAAGPAADASVHERSQSAMSASDPLLSEAINRRIAGATREPYVRAVARALCREWGDDPDEAVPVCDRSGRATGRSAAKWTLFRSEAVAAITALTLADSDAGEPLEIPAFLSAATRRTG